MMMIKRLFFGRLDRRIITFVIGVLFLPIILIYSYIIFSYADNMITVEKRAVTDTLNKMYFNTNTNIEVALLSAQVVMLDQTLNSLVTRWDAGLELSLDDLLSLKRTTVTNMQNIAAASPQISQLRLFSDMPGTEIHPAIYPLSHLDVAVLHAFQSGEVEMWRIHSVNLHANAEKRMVVSYYRQMTSPTGKLHGIVEVTFYMEDFLTQMSDSGVHKQTGYISEKMIMYYNYRSELAFMQAPWSYYINELSILLTDPGADTPRIATLNDGQTILYQTIALPKLGGSIYHIVSLNDLSQSIKSMILVFISLLSIILLPLVLIIRKGVQRMLRGIYVLIDIMRQVENGNLDPHFPPVKSDEIGEMVIHFKRMMVHIDLLMKANEQKQIIAHDAEIRALQSQINTHFLYNTLETIHMMAELEEKFEIADSISSLSYLLRYSMHWSGNVTIKHELEYIRNYVQLMQLRYDFKITLQIDVPATILSQSALKMSLQPIVENAIIHGINGRARDAVICITGATNSTRDCYEMIITDDGVGISPQKLARLQNSLAEPVISADEDTNSVGLRNVQTRIKIQFGEAYGIAIDSEQGVFTSTRMILPYQANEHLQEV